MSGPVARFITVDPAAPGQVDVEQHHVGPLLADGAHRRVDVAGLADHLDDRGAGELAADAGAEHRVVVDEDDPDRSGGRRAAGGVTGHRRLPTRAVQRGEVQPHLGALAGLERISAVPPWRAIRSRMLWRTP